MDKQQAKAELSEALVQLAEENKKLGQAEVKVHLAWVRVNEIVQVLEER